MSMIRRVLDWFASWWRHSDVEEARPRRRVVVIGGGFAGLRVARELKNSAWDVVLIDRQNHHLFQPLLYQVATAGLSAPNIAQPIRHILRQCRNTRVVYGEVTRVDTSSKTVWMDDESEGYDVLVLAAGATHSYFGNDAWAEHAPGLKTLADAQDIRSRILRAFESAEHASSDGDRMPWLRFVVVGGGPTGVEMAGAIAELAKRILRRDFRRFDPVDTEVLLVEGSDVVLGSYAKELSESAKTQLESLGVTVLTASKVTDIDADGVTMDDGKRIESKTVVWAAGVQASPLGESLDSPRDRAGRLIVEPDLTVPGMPEVFAIGDCAHVLDAAGKQVPGTAPGALQMGGYVARILRGGGGGGSDGDRAARKPFRYRDKGSMATIGRAAAVAQIGRFRLSGLLAWLGWLWIHLIFLVDFRSRVIVLINWTWSYLIYKPVACVIPDLARSGREAEPKP